MESQRIKAFRLLGIPADSDRETIARAYHRLARATHPDVSAEPGAADRFAALNEAYRLAAEPPRTLHDVPAEQVPVFTRHSEPNEIRIGPLGLWVVEPPTPAASTAPPAPPWPRPPIVAGPVHVRPIRRTGGDA